MTCFCTFLCRRDVLECNVIFEPVKVLLEYSQNTIDSMAGRERYKQIADTSFNVEQLNDTLRQCIHTVEGSEVHPETCFPRQFPETSTVRHFLFLSRRLSLLTAVQNQEDVRVTLL